MTTTEVRQRFIDFFEKRRHAYLPSASLVPKNDPSVLFNTAGMQPLVPYLMGRPHPLGNRLVSAQKCVRTGDIEEVGNHKNLTFFEMLGNWSLGDYFKEDAIKWSYEFLTSTTEGLGLDPTRLYITVFEGDNNAPRDMEAVEIWKQYIPEHRIYFLPAKNNWWSAGDNGPCGPDSEMFYDVTPKGLGDMTHEQYVAADDIGTVVEIWNDVFMQYEKNDGEVIGKLAQKNIDTGTGLERAVMVAQGKSNVYETDIFAPVMTLLKEYSKNYSERNARIVADHLRTALFLIADGITPSNKDQGYILRRIIRRAVLKMRTLMLDSGISDEILDYYADFYKDTYPEVLKKDIRSVFKAEEEKFQKTIISGLKEFDKGVDPFTLATTYGFPIEITEELAYEKGIAIDRAAFNEQMKAHQDASRAGAAAKFKGGLADTGEKTTQLHTAHHLLLAALQLILGKEVHQRGSNITEERLRIDFSFDRKMTDEEKNAVEGQVNAWIQTNHSVCRREMPRSQAEQIGAEMEFGAKYPDTVSVYFIENENGTAISKEFCGGPHVEQTSGLGTFKIQKEEAVAAGVRRIKATLS
jgi:alanyl-tRNA synthetase